MRNVNSSEALTTVFYFSLTHRQERKKGDLNCSIFVFISLYQFSDDAAGHIRSAAYQLPY